jgi:hypothetical protein
LEKDQEQKQDNLSEKLEMQKQVLESHCRVLGKDHPDTLAIMSNLAETLRALGNLSEAEGVGVVFSQNTTAALQHLFLHLPRL